MTGDLTIAEPSTAQQSPEKPGTPQASTAQPATPRATTPDAATSDPTPHHQRHTQPRIALAGNPNCGKSTLFNALTGLRQSVMNAPGTTVDIATGIWRGRDLALVDLPGTYSLIARSPDERVAADILTSRDETQAPDLAIVILDATGLARSLNLLAQVIETEVPVVAAITMNDVASTRDVAPNLDALAVAADVPVVAVDPRTGAGQEALGDVVQRVLALSAEGHTHGNDPDSAPLHRTDDERFEWTNTVLAAALPSPPAIPVRSWTDRIDRVLLHPFAGIPVFLAVMWLLFELTAEFAKPLVDGVEGLFTETIAGALDGAIPWTWLEGLIVDGVLVGVGTVLSFVPLLALIFLAIGILEDSGYLARAAFVADRGLRALGLDGRAMVPLVIGFGCNVPAIPATKTMPDERRRLLTGLLIPFTSCPARLPVYVLIAGAFFPGHVGTVVFTMYVASGLLIVLGGLALKATVFRDLRQTRPLVLALPAYHVPRLKPLLASLWHRVWAFIKGAGGIIAGTLVVVWLLSAIPVVPGHQVADVPVEDSVYGRIAQGVAPVLEPAGLNDWRVASSLVTGFVAKEVVVGNLAQSFAMADDDLDSVAEAAEDDPQAAAGGTLGRELRTALEESSGGHAAAAAWAFLAFVLAYTPCVATVAEQRRAYGWRWTGGAVVVQTVLAWLIAVGVFQVARQFN
ncbi:MAG: ferrous iron transport protein B [Cellulomonadaceae bacterium]|jgi:ferrous iron transport protein B|nr:ferrous iron transport protein B [Cellulomonadaceae bacterium]